eukprot:COSAG06_NODE_2402_length_6947_cov_4.005111_4_plen_96_part_00
MTTPSASCASVKHPTIERRRTSLPAVANMVALNINRKRNDMPRARWSSSSGLRSSSSASRLCQTVKRLSPALNVPRTAPCHPAPGAPSVQIARAP